MSHLMEGFYNQGSSEAAIKGVPRKGVLKVCSKFTGEH